MPEEFYMAYLAVAVIALVGMSLLLSKSKLPSLKQVDRMTGPQFEQWCAALLRRNGFWRVRVLGGSGDQGADIIAH